MVAISNRSRLDFRDYSEAAPRTRTSQPRHENLSPALKARLDELEARLKTYPHSTINEYERLKAGLESGGELWFFISPQETWNSLAGRGGYATVCNGKVVATVITVFS